MKIFRYLILTFVTFHFSPNSLAFASLIDFEDLQKGIEYCSYCSGLPQGHGNPDVVLFDDIGLIQTGGFNMFVSSFEPPVFIGTGGGGLGLPIDSVIVEEDPSFANKYLRLVDAKVSLSIKDNTSSSGSFELLNKEAENSFMLSINGESITANSAEELNGRTLGGVTLWVPIPFFVDGALGFYTVYFDGIVNSFQIGGRDLLVDNINLTSEVPEPTTILLLGSSLLGLYKRRKGMITENAR